jgi:hypothetical protein
VQKIAAQYKDQGVLVLAVCTQDKRSNFETWLKKNRQKYPEILFSHDPAESKPERAPTGVITLIPSGQLLPYGHRRHMLHGM